LAAGAFVRVLVRNIGCIGSGMACMGDIHGVALLMLLAGSWHILLDGERYSGESLAQRCRR
jgi:hypothetical protein